MSDIQAQIDLIDALKQASLLDQFEKYPPSHQREYIKYIKDAKLPETRARRVARMVEMIAAKQKTKEEL